MATIIKRGNTYYSNITINGKRIRKSLSDDHTIAVEMLERLKFKTLTDRYLPEEPKPIAEPEPEERIKFQDAIDAYISAKYGIKDAYGALKFFKGKVTMASQVTANLKLFMSHSGVTYVDQVTFSKLEAFMKMRRESISDNTMIRIRGFINRFFNYAENMDWILKSPARKLDMYKKTTPYRHWFKQSELDHILAGAGIYKKFDQFMLYTGLRPTDAYDVTKDNIYEHEVNGKPYMRVMMNKTKLELNVPLSDEACALIDSIDTHQLFPDSRKQGWQRRQCLNLRSNYSERDYQDKRVRNHTFRHTFAMHHLIKGTPMKVIQQLMGHTSITQTETYANLLPKEQLEEYV